MKRGLLTAVCLTVVQVYAQQNKERIISDEGVKYRYTDSGGVTASYISRFGDTLAIPALMARDSGVIHPEGSRGKTVVYNFWFTACKPCVEEMPLLNKLADAYSADSVVFIGITFDTKEKIDKFLALQQFDFKIGILTLAEIQRLKKVAFFPLTAIVDKHGHLAFVTFGRIAKDCDDAAYYDILKSQLRKALQN